MYFNPRPREEGDYATTYICRKSDIFQSTPSWRGRRLMFWQIMTINTISIHALVKRATSIHYYINDNDGISIHALVKRATNYPTNSRLFHVISIHALVKRATLAYVLAYTSFVYFNPRPREEGDGAGFKTASGVAISIHALVKRATKLRTLFLQGTMISIHALVKRATINGVVITGRTWISIHALVKRATQLC